MVKMHGFYKGEITGSFKHHNTVTIPSKPRVRTHQAWRERKKKSQVEDMTIENVTSIFNCPEELITFAVLIWNIWQ